MGVEKKQITQLEALDFIQDMAMKGMLNQEEKNFAFGQIHAMAEHMRPGIETFCNLTDAFASVAEEIKNEKI